MEQQKIRLTQIIPESIVDGVGIRYVLFSQGCPHHCKGCFNPQTHSFEGGILFDLKKIILEIKKNPLLQGVTFSGGECFSQAKPFSILAKQLKEMNLDIWAYTGYTFEHIIKHFKENPYWKELLYSIDVLVDGKFEEKEKDLTLYFRGSKNQRIIDVQKSLLLKKIILFPLDS